MTVPDLLLEQHLLGELPPELEQKVRERIEQNPEARARLEELKASNQRILEAHPPREAAEQILSRLEQARQKQGSPRIAWALPAAAAVAAITLLIWFFPALIGGPVEGMDGYTPRGGDGGGSAARLWVYGESSNDALQNGATIEAGESLRFPLY